MTSYHRRKFFISRPHEGPEEYEFEYIPVEFSDGLTRFICKSEDVPKDYWPPMVYILNMMTGSYEHVGMYENGGDERNGGNGKNIYIFITINE